MANIGDKFIIEIGAELNVWSSCKEEFEKDHNKKWYRIKGFNSLIFDDEGLRKLKKGYPMVGTWEDAQRDSVLNRPMYVCSNCKGFNQGREILQYHRSRFCPECGAFMESER